MNQSDVSLPEGYLEKRAELADRTSARVGLITSINRYLDDGVRKYSKFDIGHFGKHDWPYIKELLAQWESRGLLRIIRPIDEAAPSDVIIEMLNYIDQDKSPWPNWPVKSA